MRHLKRTYTAKMSKGERQIIAKAGNPALINWYMASKNRRKSNRTLPPFSWVYSDSLLEITLAIYLA
jgi:hypothetical protein